MAFIIFRTVKVDNSVVNLCLTPLLQTITAKNMLFIIATYAPGSFPSFFVSFFFDIFAADIAIKCLDHLGAFLNIGKHLHGPRGELSSGGIPPRSVEQTKQAPFY